MCDYCEWEDYVEKIDNMLSDGKYDFAIETLKGIKEWVEDNGHITDRQMEAVDNIYSSKD
jgi:hypothetical protein